jgi:hypothetical protein
VIGVTAYLDAATGSMLLQAIVGGAAAVAVVARLYWRRLKTFLHLSKPVEEEPKQLPDV